MIKYDIMYIYTHMLHIYSVKKLDEENRGLRKKLFCNIFLRRFILLQGIK